LPDIVKDNLLGQRLPDALRHPALHLPFDKHRIDKIAKIVNDGVAINGHNTRLAAIIECDRR